MNENVRASEGADGLIVITSAYCPKCKQDAMPNALGCCSFCTTVIVDEDLLSAKDVIAGARNRTVTKPVKPKPVARIEWTRDKIIAAVHAWYEQHGSAPGAAAWQKATSVRGPGYPHYTAVRKFFTGWADLMATAGYAMDDQCRYLPLAELPASSFAPSDDVEKREEAPVNDRTMSGAPAAPPVYATALRRLAAAFREQAAAYDDLATIEEGLAA